MAVLNEALSVVVRVEAIQRVFGDWAAFEATVPNNTLCYDDDLIRIGFMAEVDQKAYAEVLASHGLIHSTEDAAGDFVLVDQLRGAMSPCSWLDVVQVDIGTDCRVSAAMLRGSTSDMLSCPKGWTYARSLSSRYGYVVPSERDSGLRFLRHENGLDVFWNALTNEEVFTGRAVVA